ncbi:MAG: archaellin/type IV pilin N-terminal domain-containing protein [Cuniculiplasma sp.]
MKQIREKNDKAVSPIIATILLIAITVVLAATLVTILGGFTHGVSNTVVTVGATTAEVNASSSSSDLSYVVYLNISSSSTNLTASSVTLEINGTVVGTLASGTKSGGITVTGSSSLTGGANFQIVDKSSSTIHNHKITSLDLIYKGNDIYQSGTISIS